MAVEREGRQGDRSHAVALAGLAARWRIANARWAQDCTACPRTRSALSASCLPITNVPPCDRSAAAVTAFAWISKPRAVRGSIANMRAATWRISRTASSRAVSALLKPLSSRTRSQAASYPSSRARSSRARCPSSDDLRLFSFLRNGGSGSSGFEVMRPAADAASVSAGWSGA
jgi:hypothetical protein